MKNKIHNTNIENRRGCVFCLSSFCVLYPMFTAAHSWLSRRFSMFVLCILFFFVLCIVSNAYSCPFLVVPSVFYACVVYFVCLRKTIKIHNTNIENLQDNQEWAAVNIGYKHRTKTNKVVPSVFYVCVVYFVCLRSVYCIQCLQLPIPGCPVGFLYLCCVFCLSSSCKHWIQYTER
jgi:Ca2+/Na+ antiporter